MLEGIAIEIDEERIGAFCRRHHISKLWFFGSVLREDFRPNSDINVLVEFAPGKTPGLGFVDLRDELTRLLGRPVDLVTVRSLILSVGARFSERGALRMQLDRRDAGYLWDMLDSARTVQRSLQGSLKRDYSLIETPNSFSSGHLKSSARRPVESRPPLGLLTPRSPGCRSPGSACNRA